MGRWPSVSLAGTPADIQPFCYETKAIWLVCKNQEEETMSVDIQILGEHMILGQYSL